jgi:hypothetical protein
LNTPLLWVRRRETFHQRAASASPWPRGVDYEGRTHAQRERRQWFESALRLLDEHCRVLQYVIKRRIDPIIPAPCAAGRERGDSAPQIASTNGITNQDRT